MSKVELQVVDDINNDFKAHIRSVHEFNNSFDWPQVNTFVYKEVDGLKIEADVWVWETLPNGDSQRVPAKRPVALFIHGGGWMGGIRTDFPKPLLHEFVSRGYVYVSIDYRLLPEVDFITEQLEDIRSVEGWIREKLQGCLTEKGVNVTVDTDTIAVLGGSAGSHLASLTPKIWKKKPSALLLMAGPTDLFDSRRLGRPMGGGKLDAVVAQVPMDPTPEFIKSAMFDGPKTNAEPSLGIESFMLPRAMLGISIFMNELMAEFLVLGLQDGKLPKKGSAPKEKIEFISAAYGDLSDWPPTFQMIGDNDEAFEASQLTKFHDRLRQLGIPSGVLVVPESSHAFEGMSKIGDNVHLRYIKPACEFLVRHTLKEDGAK
ncbi:hypothetical protein AYL99_09677 [Fonsecaea erecta]|uniref:BD-FAE-like domain-containing protein n=1 Tax=Fonsecaea erecta TaxID=1367422 RepID=A0A178Z9N5_9EURO|nr:hypothetical protein AYL99_09677 [Fonsecaea erecta]OAP56498.1 hypothetical protein AYL99_09677 [Fonsecaea erecta]